MSELGRVNPAIPSKKEYCSEVETVSCRAAQERIMNREQSDTIARLHRERTVKFDEIVLSLAVDLGYGDPAMLSQDDKDTLADEAEQTIELWEEDAEMADELPKVVTSQQILLSQYHELGERILNLDRDARL